MPPVLADILYPLTEQVANGVTVQRWGLISDVAFVPDDRPYLDNILGQVSRRRCLCDALGGRLPVWLP